METPLSGTPQSGRKRPAVAAAQAATASGATPGRGSSTNSRAASTASPRGSSLLTPEPAQKRRGLSRGGPGRSVGLEGGGGGGGGNSATPNSVFTPGTGTAHLLLQLRRDWAQQQQGPPQQQQQQQFSQGGSGGAAPPPPPPLQSGDGVGSAPAGEENLSEDAAALIRSCSYAVAPGNGRGGGGSVSSIGSDANFCDQRGRPAPTSGEAGLAGAAAAGSKGSAVRAPRGASRSWRDDRRAAVPASCGGRRGRGGGNGGSNGNGAQKPALASTAAAAAVGGDRPRNQAVGAPAGVGGAGPAPAGRGMPYSGEAVPAASVALDGCSCKKSMCLKLYCQCFAGQHICSAACKCENCLNSDAHGAERRAAVRELLSRSPHAFDAKFKTEVLTADGGTGAARAAVVHNTGCGCSKSACLKRYCECFNGGIACSDKCRCKDCRNTAKAVGARTRAKNMAAKSSMLNAGAAAAAAAAASAASGAGLGAAAGGGRRGVGGAVTTGGGERGPGGGAGTFREVAAAATAAAFAAAAAVQHGRGAKTMAHSSAQEQEQDGGHGKGNINIDVGGGGDGAAAAVGRAPLGVLPGGRADGDHDSDANRGTFRV